MAHGVYPGAAAGHARLVRGVPVYGAGEGELLTPTGALLVTALRHGLRAAAARCASSGVGYGAGTRDTAEPAQRPAPHRGRGWRGARARHTRVLVLECEIDDMSPQLFGPLVERLLARGRARRLSTRPYR